MNLGVRCCWGRFGSAVGDVIKIYTAASLQDAHILLGLFAAQRIEARVMNASAQGGLGEIPFIQTYPEIWLVDARDLERARAVIADFDRPLAAGMEVRCVECGEDSPGGFAVCWKCGTSLDSA